MKLVNTIIQPPFRWINQWRSIRRTGLLSPITICVERNRDQGLHFEFCCVVIGLGFVWRWYDRNERAAFLAWMDQVECEIKDAVRADNPDVVFEGEDE